MAAAPAPRLAAAPPTASTRSVPANDLASHMLTDHQRGASVPVLGHSYSDDERVQQWVHQHASCGAGARIGPSASIEHTPHPSACSSPCASPRVGAISAPAGTFVQYASRARGESATGPGADALDLCTQPSVTSSAKCPELPPAPPAPPPDSASQSATLPGPPGASEELESMMNECGLAALEPKHGSFCPPGPTQPQRRSACGVDAPRSRHNLQHPGPQHARAPQRRSVIVHARAARPPARHHSSGTTPMPGSARSLSHTEHLQLPHPSPLRRPRTSMDARSASDTCAVQQPPKGALHPQQTWQPARGGRGFMRQQSGPVHYTPRGPAELQRPMPHAAQPLAAGHQAMGRGHSITFPPSSGPFGSACRQAPPWQAPAQVRPQGAPARPCAPAHPAMPMPVQMHSAMHGAQGMHMQPAPLHAAMQAPAPMPRPAAPVLDRARPHDMQRQQSQQRRGPQRRLSASGEFPCTRGQPAPAQAAAAQSWSGRPPPRQQQPRSKQWQHQAKAAHHGKSAALLPMPRRNGLACDGGAVDHAQAPAKAAAHAHASSLDSPVHTSTGTAALRPRLQCPQAAHAQLAGNYQDTHNAVPVVAWESDLTRFLTEVERLFVPLTSQAAGAADMQSAGADATPSALAVTDVPSTVSHATGSIMRPCQSGMMSIDESCQHTALEANSIAPGTASRIDDVMAGRDGLQLLQQPAPPARLADLWEPFRECSAMCLEVPTVNGATGPSYAYFAPSLSAMQITAVRDSALPACHTSHNSRDHSFEGFASETDDEQRSTLSGPHTPPVPVLSNASALETVCVRSEAWSTHAGDSAVPSTPRTRAQSADPSELPVATRDPDAIGGSKGQQHLVANWAATGKPWDRPPLMQQLEALCMAEPSLAVPLPAALWHMPLHALHPESWFAVMWLPLYRIPDGELKARFITYHRIVPCGAKGAVSANGAADADCRAVDVQLAGLLVNTGDSACSWTDWSSCDALGVRLQCESEVQQELQDLRATADAHSRSALYVQAHDGTWVPAPFEHSDHRFVSNSMQ